MPQSPSLHSHCLLGSHERISLPTLQSLCATGAHICLSWIVPIPLQHRNQSLGSLTQSCMQGYFSLEHQALSSFERALRHPPDFSSLYAQATRNVPCQLKKKPSWRSFCSSATQSLPSSLETLIMRPRFSMNCNPLHRFLLHSRLHRQQYSPTPVCFKQTILPLPF